jgi:IS5 family transposase
MNQQTSFAQSEYARKKKTTRREKFLRQMDQVVPWARLVGLIVPRYPEGKRGRPPVGIERMLRIYFLQQWYALADEALEDALYDSQALRNFAGIDLGREAVPDATTLLKFRHLLEAHELTRRIFEEVGALLGEKQLLMREGTLIDATIIAAPCSTKNRRRERDPDMHQTKKGNQWYFGMKAHIGADESSGLVHSVEGTAANVSDISQAHTLLHGEEKRAGADAGYTGVEKRPEVVALGREIEWRVAPRRSALKAQPEGWAKAIGGAWEKLKARARALVEHPFHIIKNIFRHRKVRYRGLEKNTGQLRVLFALANLYMVRRQLTRAAAV